MTPRELTKHEWKTFGCVGKPHGLKGSFYVQKQTRPLPADLKTIRLGDSPHIAYLESQVLEIKSHRDKAILTVDKIPDRTVLDTHKGVKIWAAFPQSKFSEFDELIDFQVKDNLGELLGKVKQFYNYGASDVMEIQSAEEKILEIPFLDSYILKIEKQQNTIILSVPKSNFEGLWS